VFSYI